VWPRISLATFQIAPGREQHRGRAVLKVVQADGRERRPGECLLYLVLGDARPLDDLLVRPALGVVPADEPGEVLRRRLGAERLAVLAGNTAHALPSARGGVLPSA
jgi:hypothetical protein